MPQEHRMQRLTLGAVALGIALLVGIVSGRQLPALNLTPEPSPLTIQVEDRNPWTNEPINRNASRLSTMPKRGLATRSSFRTHGIARSIKLAIVARDTVLSSRKPGNQGVFQPRTI